MFEDFDDREIERLRISWGKDNALPLRTRYELVENRWYPAKIERVKTEVTRGKPRAQVFFDVQGVRLIKDFWLTEKGIFVFKGFLKKFGLCIRDLHDLDESQLIGENCEVFVLKKAFKNGTWVEVDRVRRSVRQ